MKKRANWQHTAEINVNEKKRSNANENEIKNPAEKKRAQQKAGQTTPVSRSSSRTNPHGCPAVVWPGALWIFFGGVAANEQ